MSNNLHQIAIILAAGKGTRMQSDLPKVLHRINGVPMIKIIVNTLKKTGTDKIFVVVGYNSELVKTCLINFKVEFLEQVEQLGTAHAVLQAEEKLKDYKGEIIVVNGDSPLVEVSSIKKLIEEHRLYKPAATILTSFLDNPAGYGRIIRVTDTIIEIKEDKDASEEERTIKEINVGVYCFDSVSIFPFLREVKADNVKGEMYLTDVIKIFKNKNLQVRGVVTTNSEEVIGVDTPEKLIKAEEILMKRENAKTKYT